MPCYREKKNVTRYPCGIDNGQHWLAIDWIEGDSPSELAFRWRHQCGPAARRHLADLGVRILRAFAVVYEQGFVHGDVHPGNILIAGDGSVKLLDFALTRALSQSDPLYDAPRGAVAWYWEPEFAQAILNDCDWPMTTMESEKYALAVLVDWLLTNTFYINFSANQERIYAQVLTDTSRSFAERGGDGIRSGENVEGLWSAKPARSSRRVALPGRG